MAAALFPRREQVLQKIKQRAVLDWFVKNRDAVRFQYPVAFPNRL
jgi:hypothetical protein